MKARACLKEIYPVTLLIVVLMTWAAVGVTDQSYSAPSHMEWSRLLKSPTVKDTCKDNSLFFVTDPTCEDERGKKMVSPVFTDKNSFSQLLSKLEQDTKFKTQ